MIHIVVDLEMNPVEKFRRRNKPKTLSEEIIEIGAVKLNDAFEKISEYQSYVHPERSDIKPTITQLTKITNEKVADAEKFAEAFKNFLEWVFEKKIDYKKMNDLDFSDVLFYSWSDADIKQIRNECYYKLETFDTKKISAAWIDLQKEFDNRLGLHATLSLQHAIGAMNKNFEGTAHTALADAINTADILILMQDNDRFQQVMSPIKNMLHREVLTTSIADLCPELANFKVQVS